MLWQLCVCVLSTHWRNGEKHPLTQLWSSYSYIQKDENWEILKFKMNVDWNLYAYCMQSYSSHTILHRVKSGFVFYSNKVDFKTNPFLSHFLSRKILFFYFQNTKKNIICIKKQWSQCSLALSVWVKLTI